MLLNVTILLLGKFYSFACRIGITSFEWNHADQSLQLTTSNIRLIYWVIVVSFTIFKAIFIGIRLFQGIFSLGSSMEVIVFGVYALICWATVALFNLNTLIFKNELIVFINHFLSSNRSFKRILWKAPDPTHLTWSNMDISAKLITTLSLLSCIFCFGMFWPVLFVRTNPTFLYSVFNSVYYDDKPWWYLIPWGIFEVYNTILGAGAILFYVFTLYAYIFSINGILGQLKYGTSTASKQKIITEFNFGVFYRQLQLVNSSYNSAFKEIILPLLTGSLMTITMSCTFAAFKLFNTLGFLAFYILPLMSFLSISTVLIIFPVCFRVNTTSVSVLESWEQQAQANDVCKREIKASSNNPIPSILAAANKVKVQVKSNALTHAFLKSCQPLGIRVGFVCLIKPITVVEYFALVLTGTMNLLLTF